MAGMELRGVNRDDRHETLDGAKAGWSPKPCWKNRAGRKEGIRVDRRNSEQCPCVWPHLSALTRLRGISIMWNSSTRPMGTYYPDEYDFPVPESSKP